jgi:SP family galactose:H+ symporter-like MFS transporter
VGQFYVAVYTVSAVLIGAILGAAVGGKMADWLGRKKTLIIMAIIFAVGAVLTAFAPSLWPFVILRIIVGFGIGASSVVAPMYTSELSPPAIRGKLVFLFQLMITVGILVAYLVDLGFSSAGLGWPPMFAVAVIPAAALGVGMFFLHDTPRWLASKGRWDEATAVMRRVVPTGADAEMGRIKTRLEEATHASTHELFHYYAPIVTGYSGFGASATGSSLIGAILVGVVNVLATILALFLVDRVGRRPLLLFGSCGVCLTLAATGFIFMIGAPQHGLLLLIVLLLYIVSFAIGLGPTYWLIAAEVFPTRLRATGSSISTVGNWSANLIVSITFLTLINMLGKSVTFWIYAAFAVVQIVFIWFLVPETKGKPLEAIEQYWQHGRSWARVDGGAAGREDDHMARAGAATPTSGSGHGERTAGQTAPLGAGYAAPVAIDTRASGLDRVVHVTTQDGSAADRDIDVHVTTRDGPAAGAGADGTPPKPG